MTEFNKYRRRDRLNSKDRKRTSNGVPNPKLEPFSREFKNISLKLITDNPDQARSQMDSEKFEVLKNSIAREGIISPLVVYKQEGKDAYRLMAGHRRIRALRELGKEEARCLVYISITDAIFAAISTNEFVESIHPIDKGIEVQSLLNEFKDKDVQAPHIDSIANFYGVSKITIYQWLKYASIDKSVRGMIIDKDIRSKDFLRKATKICKHIESMNLDEEERLAQINLNITLLIEDYDKRSKNNSSKKVKNTSPNADIPKFRNFLFYEKSDDAFKIRTQAIAKLSNEDRGRLLEKSEELVQLLKEVNQ